MATVEFGEPQRSVTQFLRTSPLRRSKRGRISPQVHSLWDYGLGLLGVFNVLIAQNGAAKISNTVLAGAHLSLVKLLPIEVRRAVDRLHGATNLLSPFIWQYHRKEPLISGLQIFAGLTTLLLSLRTEYRKTGPGRRARTASDGSSRAAAVTDASNFPDSEISSEV